MRQRGLTAPTSTPPVRARTGLPADPTAAAVLRLQRAAGNAAVAGVMRQRRLARARHVPANPTSLADYSALAGEISYDTGTGDPVVPKTLPGLFDPKGARFNPRSGFDVSFNFSKDIAKEHDKEALVQTGLANIARALFNLTDTSTDPVKKGTTTILKFDLERYGGRDGRYRFTSVAGEKAGEVQILIEYLGPAPAPLSSWDALGPKGQAKLTDRFARFGFTWGDGDVGWSYDKKGQVMQALALIPDPVLNEVSGITWERRKAKLSPEGNAGFYDGNGRKVLLYTSAFDTDWGMIEIVAHELGHGLSYRPQERKHTTAPHQDEPAYHKATGALAQAVTEYGRKSFAENFAEGFSLFIEEPDTLKLLRPDVFDYFTKLVAGLPAAP
jgi:hypothetical protein